MTQYNTLNLKLFDSQLFNCLSHKWKLGIKNGTEITSKISN